MKPRTDKTCQQCGLCARKCPVGAIPLGNPSKTDAGKCISCMRCIVVCPQKARSVSKTLLAAGSLKMKKVCSVRKGNELFV
jgi:Dissimilatory sulfite reductase (desulfoviridin), alpha and beta subunits